MSKKPTTYFLLKLNSLVKSHRVKFFGLWLLHKFNRRYLSVNFDPINACNLRCKMCYFTDENYVKTLKGVFPKEDLPLWAERILPRALKLQVGCGTEPTLYKHLDTIFELAKQFKVPHISLTTNANLLEKESLEQWIRGGLNEIIVSLHGVHRENYEFYMGKGDYDRFHQSLQWITELKATYPNLSLRINYTFNKDNFNELQDFFEVYGKYEIDTIQLRPISNLGKTAYHDFDLKPIYTQYPVIISEFKAKAKQKNISIIAPESIERLENRKNTESLIFIYTYCYISPIAFWHNDFDWRNETYIAYCNRTGWSKKILQNVWKSRKEMETMQTENLNYDIELN